MITLQNIINELRDKCYEFSNAEKLTLIADNDTMCETVFDGLYCWPYTQAGVLAVQPCTNDRLKTTKRVCIIPIRQIAN